MSTANRYSKICQLGCGTYGIVYKVRDRQTNEVCALKRMKPACEEEGLPATTMREIALLQMLRHPNIVHLKDTLYQPPKLTLVFEYCQYDLQSYIETNPTIAPEMIRRLMHQLLKGLAFMHEHDVVHRDLKPQNLLLHESEGDVSLKIGDFGLARVEGIVVKKYSHEAVTLWYRPPDVILGSTNYGLAVDMWSAGCIFVEMITGKPLFKGRTDAEQIRRMFTLLGSPLFSSPSEEVHHQHTFPNRRPQTLATTVKRAARMSTLDLDQSAPSLPPLDCLEYSGSLPLTDGTCLPISHAPRARQPSLAVPELLGSRHSALSDSSSLAVTLATPTPTTPPAVQCAEWPSLSLYPKTQTFFRDNAALMEPIASTFSEFSEEHHLGRIGQEGIDLILMMLRFEPSARVTASQALQHPYFANV